MTQDPGIQRVRSYLLTQSERHDWDALWPRVIGSRLELLTETLDLSEEQANFKASPEEWSIYDCLEHVLRGSRGSLKRVEALAAGNLTLAQEEAQQFDHNDSQPSSDIEANSYTELRAQLIADSSHYAGILDRLPSNPNLEITLSSPFGELNSRAWFLFQRLHDTDHLGQIRAIKDAPDYPDA